MSYDQRHFGSLLAHEFAQIISINPASPPHSKSLDESIRTIAEILTIFELCNFYRLEIEFNVDLPTHPVLTHFAAQVFEQASCKTLVLKGSKKDSTTDEVNRLISSNLSHQTSFYHPLGIKSCTILLENLTSQLLELMYFAKNEFWFEKVTVTTWGGGPVYITDIFFQGEPKRAQLLNRALFKDLDISRGFEEDSKDSRDVSFSEFIKLIRIQGKKWRQQDKFQCAIY